MIARWIVRRAAAIVPLAQRADWRREWDAELIHRMHTLEARGALTAGARVRLTALAAGALAHAVWLRKQDWSPTMLLQEIKLAARALARRPGFTIAAVLTLALGMGANTAIFSVVYGVLLRPLPFHQPHRLVQVWETNPLRGWTEANVAPANLLDWRARNQSFEAIGYYFGSDTRESGPTTYTMTEGEARRLDGLRVSANLFDVLGVAPVLGRGFVPEYETPGRHRVMLLSHALWRGAFGGDPNIVGRKVDMAGSAWEIIGVMPESFRLGSTPIDFYAPMAAAPGALQQSRRPHYLKAIARLKPGVTIDQARDEMARIARDLERQYPDTNTQMGVGLGPLRDWFVGPAQRPLLVLLGAVGFVLLIACANVGSLVLARGASRARELAIRTTLGASRFRIARQLMAESLVLAAAGTALGFLLAWGGVRALLLAAPPNLPRAADIGLDLPVLGFTAAIGCLAAVVFGLAPALWAARSSLGHGTRTTGGHAAMRRALIVAEVALAVVLVAGAGLMLRSLLGLQRVHPGFNASQLLTAQITLPGLRYDTDEKSQQFFEQLLARLRALPGVTNAAAARKLPLGGYDWTSDLFIEGREGSQVRELRHNTVTPGYFETIGLPVIAGRIYTAADDARAQPVIVINDTLARRAFPGENPIGRRITSGRGANAVWRTIIGVVADEKQDALNEPTEPEVYWSHLQTAESQLAIVMRAKDDAAALAPALREAVKSVDRHVAVAEIAPMDALIDESLSRERFSATLISVFGATALALAAVGIYGLAAFLVASRLREFGVRLALGATRADVFTLVLRQNLTLAVAGLAAGIVLALFLSRAIESLLYGVGPRDPLSLAAAAGLLLAVAIAASLIPARRAVRIDPAIALRAE